MQSTSVLRLNPTDLSHTDRVVFTPDDDGGDPTVRAVALSRDVWANDYDEAETITVTVASGDRLNA